MDTLCNTSNTSTLPTISDKTPTPLWLYHTVSDKTSTRKTDPHGHNLFSRYHEVHLSVRTRLIFIYTQMAFAYGAKYLVWETL
jgi:hypothetical protein